MCTPLTGECDLGLPRRRSTMRSRQRWARKGTPHPLVAVTTAVITLTQRGLINSLPPRASSLSRPQVSPVTVSMVARPTTRIIPSTGPSPTTAVRPGIWPATRIVTTA